MSASTFPTARVQQSPTTTLDVAIQPLIRSHVEIQVALDIVIQWH